MRGILLLAKNYICDTILGMKIIDAHSHIDYITHDFQSDVVSTVVCATRESEWEKLTNLTQNDICVHGAFGVHPWFVDSVDMGWDVRLESLLKTNRNFMVGEIGLDKNYPNMDKQIEIFQYQFDIASRLKRIVFVHCVGAWDKILHVLKQYKISELPIIVFHSFNASDDVINNLLKNYKNNVYFSFGKNALYGGIRCITQIPDDKILVESDGKFDVMLRDIIDKILIEKNNPDMANIIYNNAVKVLKNG